MNGKYGILLAAALLAAFVSPSAARDADPLERRIARSGPKLEAPLPDGLDTLGLYEAAAVDTYCSVWYDFETVNWQGWTRLDFTAQRDTFFHVDDFAGLGGGDFGRLRPIEGSKSMWCGARPNAADPYLCGWHRAPGYGNEWGQELATGPVFFTGPLTFSYRLMYDCEDGYDSVEVTCDVLNGKTVEIASYSGAGSAVVERTLYLQSAHTKFRFRFTSDGAFSDEDGLWDTDGACIVDSIAVSDAEGLIDFQDFDAAPTGALGAGIWQARILEPFGTYSGLLGGLYDKDPCGDNFGTQVVFFIGSSLPAPGYPWPGLPGTPFCAGAGGMEDPCQDEMVVSPLIDLRKYSTALNNVQDGAIPPGDLALLGRTFLSYGAYEDLPLKNLVFGRWFVRTVTNGCPGIWTNDGGYYWSRDPLYAQRTFDLTRYITGDTIQVALGVVDMCSVWYPELGNCATHTPAPWYDNVRVHRAKSAGPQWAYYDYNLFQDSFPEVEYYLESAVRADAAIDVNPPENPAIRPGDSITVDCFSIAGGGIALDPAGGPAVYLHVKCSYIGPAPLKPPLAGAQLQGSMGIYKSDDGTWTIIQCDTARAPGATAADRYAVDLNDALFTRGYQIEYYFTARDAAGEETALPRWARSYGPYFEFTCLPTMNSEVLYVDDYHAIGSFAGTAENYWRPTIFHALPPPTCYVDRYDVMSPEEGVSNGPGSRAKNYQLIGGSLWDGYRAIVWDSGDLASCTISDGTPYSDKSDDCQMLIDWMEFSEHECGLWICGDDVAEDLAGSTTARALALMSTWCGVSLIHGSYFDLTGGYSGGGMAAPLMTGDPDANIFVHYGYPDKLYAFGGCPAANSFDALGKIGTAKNALRYPDYSAAAYYSAVAGNQLNSGGFNVRTMWFGFSLQYVRDNAIDDSSPIDRHEIAKDTFNWLLLPTNPDCCHSGAEIPKAYRLAQNFPNPFNPVTTIQYDMRAKGVVTIKIYDVAGRLVRTLVEGVKDAGSWAAVWDGTNNLGAGAASGIYFCRMEASGFSAAKKIVLLR